MIPSRSNRIPIAIAIALSGLCFTSTLATAAPTTTIKSAITKKGAVTADPVAPKSSSKVAKAAAKVTTKSSKTTATTVVKKKSTPTSAPTDTKAPEAKASDTKAPTSTTPAEPTTTKKSATTASTTATSAPAPLTKAGMVFIPGAGRVLDLDANQVAKLAAGGSVAPDVRGANGLASLT
jgi:RNA polymerase primary sigma factor